MNKYEEVAQKIHKEVEEQSGKTIKVEYRKSGHTGMAYLNRCLIKCPPPNNLKRLSLYIHELGHFLYIKERLSCVTEYQCEMFALEQLRKHGFRIPKEIKADYARYIAYSLGQALNRGLINVPKQLKPYLKFLNESEITLIYGSGERRKVKRYRVLTLDRISDIM